MNCYNLWTDKNKIEWICKFTKDKSTYYVGESSSGGDVFYVSKVIDGEEIIYIDEYTGFMDFSEVLNGSIKVETITQAEGDEIVKKLTNVTEYLKRKEKEQLPCYLMQVAEDGIACAEFYNDKLTRYVDSTYIKESNPDDHMLSMYILGMSKIRGASSIISKEIFEKQWNQGYGSITDFIKLKW